MHDDGDGTGGAGGAREEGGVWETSRHADEATHDRPEEKPPGSASIASSARAPSSSMSDCRRRSMRPSFLLVLRCALLLDRRDDRAPSPEVLASPISQKESTMFSTRS